MDSSRQQRMMDAYLAADGVDGATSETVLAAVYKAVPDATREEIGAMIKQRLDDLGEQVRFAAEISQHENVAVLPSKNWDKAFASRKRN